VPLDLDTLERLKRAHPAWRLLTSDHAPLVIGFLHGRFAVPNARGIAQSELVSKLDDLLFHIRETSGVECYPRSSSDYLNEWASDEKGWLRKYYPAGSDEPAYDLTSAAEKAIGWIEGLMQRAFVGTESRLLTVVDLLRQLVERTDADPVRRIEELEKRKTELDAEIGRIRGGELPLLDDTAIRERFQHVATTARELLADFREVEQNFRTLDRKTRERIALWDGSKGALLESILGERDAIADSDQGKSFRAFWDFLMSPDRQDELSVLLDAEFALPPVRELAPDQRLRRIHYEWLDAGGHTQRTVAMLSAQLRRFLDDQAQLENRRIMHLLHEIEGKALAIRARLPKGAFMEIDEQGPTVELPMDRPLFSFPLKPVIGDHVLDEGVPDFTTDPLFGQCTVDKTVLRARIRHSLQDREQVTLRALLSEYPLEQGLAELLGYLSLAGEDRKAMFDESQEETVSWSDGEEITRTARLPRIIFCR